MKNILITGGTRGIGRAAALLCAKQGLSVALNYQRDALAAERSPAKYKGPAAVW